MTITGHIKLGIPGDLRDYVLTDINAYSKVLVNPYAVKMSQGAGSYDSYDGWAYWLQENWSLGVGVEYPEPNGYYYGEIDSRHEGRLMLLPRTYPTSLSPQISSTSWNHPGNYEYEFVVGDEGAFERIALPLGAFTGTLGNVWVHFKNDSWQTSTSADIYSGSEPTTLVQSVALASDGTTLRSGYRKGTLTPALTGDGVTQYWIVIESPTRIEVPAMSGDFDPATIPLVWDGASWLPASDELGTDYRAFFLTDLDTLPPVTAGLSFNGEWYVGCLDGGIYKRVGAGEENEYYQQVALANGPILDMIEWWGKVVLILDNTTVQAMDPGETLSLLSFTAQVATIHRGFFWYATGNQVFYDSSEDLDTSSNPIDLRPTDTVRGMDSAGTAMLVSTDTELYQISEGDFVFALAKWDYPDPTHGKGMLQREGMAYIPYGNTLLRYAANAPLTNIWLRNVPLPNLRQGDLVGLVSTNKELILLVNSEGQDTAWSWNNQGWHCVAAFPPGMVLDGAKYDYTTKRIYFFMADGYTFWIPASVPDNLPSQDTDALFEPDSWLDTGNWYANLYSIEKDIESIEIVGDDITSERPISVYWRDDDTSENSYMLWADGTSLLWADGDTWETSSDNWRYLGTVSSGGQVLRWDDPDVRPATRSLRLGLLLQTRNQERTPIVRAIVVRHHPTVYDRFQHQLPISLADEEHGLEGLRDARTARDMALHIDTLVGSVAPVLFVDPFGVEREVKVTHASVRLTDYEVRRDSSTLFDIVYDITVEEVLEGRYTKPEAPEVPEVGVPEMPTDELFDWSQAEDSQYIPATVPFP